MPLRPQENCIDDPDRRGSLFSFLLRFRRPRKQKQLEIVEDSALNESKRRIEQRIELALQIMDDSSLERRMLALVPTPRVPAQEKPPRVAGLFVAEDYYLKAQDEGWYQEKRAAVG